MPRNLWSRCSIVAVVAAVSLWYLYPPGKTINLGLDLQGGIHLGLGVEADKHVSSQTERAAEDLKNGLERKGVGVKRVAREGLSSIVVEQHPHMVLQVSDEAIVLDRGGIALRANSASLLRDPTPLDPWLGVASHA